MLKALLQRDAEVRVEHQDLLQEVDSFRRRTRVFLLEVGTWVALELLKVLKCFKVSHKTFV